MKQMAPVAAGWPTPKHVCSVRSGRLRITRGRLFHSTSNVDAELHSRDYKQQQRQDIVDTHSPSPSRVEGAGPSASTSIVAKHERMFYRCYGIRQLDKHLNIEYSVRVVKDSERRFYAGRGI